MKKNIIIIVLGLICIALISYIIYDKTSNNKNAEYQSINIEILSMDKPTIYLNRDEKLMVTGKMNISYDENIYSAVIFTGYCLGENGESYDIYGPTWGKTSFYNDDTEYSLTNVAPQVEPDWSNVKIKSCEISSATAYISETDENTGLSHIVSTTIKEINYQKSF